MISNSLSKISNSEIYELDKREYFQEFGARKDENSKLKYFISFAYLTPNPLLLFSLEELHRVAEIHAQFFFVFWDLNLFSNPYYKKKISKEISENKEYYIKNKIVELKKIVSSVGFREESFQIYLASDIWKRLTTIRKDNLFQIFYNVTAQLKVGDFVNVKKVSNSLRISLDMMFCYYFHKLFPEDISGPIDIFFFGEESLKQFEIIRKGILSEEESLLKRPLFLVMKPLPTMRYNNYVPEWNLDIREIKRIIDNTHLTKEELLSIYRNIKLFHNGLEQEKLNALKLQDKSVLKEKLPNYLFSYLKDKKKKFDVLVDDLNAPMITLQDVTDIKNIGQVLKSDISLKIMFLSDGTKSTTDISKILSKSLPTISTYCNHLKKLNLINVSKDGKLKRKIKGIKLNFESAD